MKFKYEQIGGVSYEDKEEACWISKHKFGEYETPEASVRRTDPRASRFLIAQTRAHSGRHTFITRIAKKIVEAGGSLRDVQGLAGHASLTTTQRYVQGDYDVDMGKSIEVKRSVKPRIVTGEPRIITDEIE